jgi:hypothetical protein
MMWDESEGPQEPQLSPANGDLRLRNDLLPNFPLQRTGARDARTGPASATLGPFR